jgi:hypothetical protein
MNRRPSTPTALRLLVSLLLLAGLVQAAPSRAAPLRAPTVPPSEVSLGAATSAA